MGGRFVGTGGRFTGTGGRFTVNLQSSSDSDAGQNPARFAFHFEEKGEGNLGKQEKDHAKNQRNTEVEVGLETE